VHDYEPWQGGQGTATRSYGESTKQHQRRVENNKKARRGQNHGGQRRRKRSWTAAGGKKPTLPRLRSLFQRRKKGMGLFARNVNPWGQKVKSVTNRYPARPGTLSSQETGKKVERRERHSVTIVS